jgi:tRNA threonylcarbamoyl adenosine modification protein YjeE
MHSESSELTRFLRDAAATEAFGRALGERLRPGDVVGLTGELGAGKTLFCRGIAEGLRVDDPDSVCSPTYLLVVEHPGPIPFLHADAYLPAKLQGFLHDGGLDYLSERNAVVAVEWADRIRALLPAATLWLHLEVPPGGGRLCRFAGNLAPFPWLRELARS